MTLLTGGGGGPPPRDGAASPGRLAGAGEELTRPLTEESSAAEGSGAEDAHPPASWGLARHDDELAIALATALMVPTEPRKVMLIDPENNRQGYAELTDAVAIGKAYAVRIARADRHHTIVLDFDTALGEAERDAQDADRLLGRFDIPHILVRSSSTGWHVWIPLAVPLWHTTVRRLIRPARRCWTSLDAGTLQHRNEGHARPPLAPHRREDLVSWPVCGAERALEIAKGPGASADDIIKLARTLSGGGPAKGDPVDPFPGCTAYGSAGLLGEAESLAGPKTPRGDDSASRGRRRAIAFAKAESIGQLVAGGALDHAIAVEHLMTAALAAGMAEEDARRAVTDGLAAGARSPRSAPGGRFVANATAATWVAAMRATRWGRCWSGPAVVDAVISMMISPSGTLIPDRTISRRALAEMANVGQGTAWARMRDLAARGLLDAKGATGWTTDSADGLTCRMASTFSAALPAEFCEKSPTTGSGGGPKSPMDDFSPKSSPRDEEAIAAALSECPSTASEVAGRAGHSIGTAKARYHLRKWVRLGQVAAAEPPAAGQRGSGRPAVRYAWAPGHDIQTLAAILDGSRRPPERRERLVRQHAIDRLQQAVALAGKGWKRELEIAARNAVLRAAIPHVVIRPPHCPSEATPVVGEGGEIVATVTPNGHIVPGAPAPADILHFGRRPAAEPRPTTLASTVDGAA